MVLLNINYKTYAVETWTSQCEIVCCFAVVENVSARP